MNSQVILDTTLLQWSLLSGVLFGLGLALIIAWTIPNRPHLGAFLSALTTESPRRLGPTGTRAAASPLDRIGHWVMRIAPAMTLPETDLDLLRIPPHLFVARRVVYGVLGATATTLVTAALVAVGLRPPIALPVLACLGLGLGASYLPLLDVRTRAATRRDEFSFQFGAYVDLVAMEHHSGTGTRQAMEIAAEGGDSWVFTRLAEELRRSRLGGQTPWAALEHLGERIGLLDLTDFAAIMRLAGEEGGAIYETLRARAATMRQTRLAQGIAEANRVGERMSAVTALLAVVFLILVGTPAVLRFLTL